MIERDIVERLEDAAAEISELREESKRLLESYMAYVRSASKCAEKVEAERDRMREALEIIRTEARELARALAESAPRKETP